MNPALSSKGATECDADDFLGLFSGEIDVIRLQAGQELFGKGETGRHMYVIKSGQVQIADGNHVFETVSAGGIVGEMALISEEPRSATVRALADSVVIAIDERRFSFMTQRTPFFALRVMKVMSARLKAMNDWATSLAQ